MYVLSAEGRVQQLRFLPDGRLLVGLVTPGVKGVIKVWSLPSGTGVRIPLSGWKVWRHAAQLAVHPSGDWFALAGGRLSAFRTSDGKSLPGRPRVARAGNRVGWLDHESPRGPSPARVESDEVACSPDQEHLLIVRHLRQARGSEYSGYTTTGDLLLLGMSPDPRSHVAGFLPGGERFVLIENRQVSVHRFRPCRVEASTEYPSTRVDHVQLSPDGRHLMVTGPRSLYLYDVTALGTPRQVTEDGSAGDFVSIAFHPSGRTLAVIHSEPTLVKIYDLETLTLRSHLNWKLGPLTCVTFSPDGLLGAAGSEDGRVVVWDVDE